ncbi:MAG: phosphate ABC transporter permease subunit PstC [Pseudomonadota bacterium]
MLTIALLGVVILGIAGYVIARQRAVAVSAGETAALHSRPGYHGLYALTVTILVGIGVFIVASAVGSWYLGSSMRSALTDLDPTISGLQADRVLQDARALATGGVTSAVDALREELSGVFSSVNATRLWGITILTLGGSIAALLFALQTITTEFRARNKSETIFRTILWSTAAVAIVTTVMIFIALIGETLNFFTGVLDWRIDKFLFGLTWSPLSGVHTGEMSPDKVGAVPLFVGTLMITVIAMLVAIPIGLFAAIYLSEFASGHVRAWAKPMLEILAGIPTVVYGFFAATTVAPFMVGMGESLGISVEAESALAAGIVMGIMIIPFISSLSDDVINAVPQSLRDGSYGLGATRAETIMKVVLPAALPGIVSASLLGISRAVGETMIVVMAVGQSANLTFNPLDKVTTVTVQITMLILGDTEAETAAGPAYTLGFALFAATLSLNIVALRIVRKYRQKYD